MFQKHYAKKYQTGGKSTILRQEKPSGKVRYPVWVSMYRRYRDVVSCIWEQTTGYRWGRQVLSQKQVNTMQVAAQSHRHERQGESTVRTCALWSPLWEQLGSRLRSWGWTLWWRRPLPEVLQLWGWQQLPAFDNPWVVSHTTVFPFLFFSPSFIISITNSLHGIPSPMLGFCFLD